MFDGIFRCRESEEQIRFGHITAVEAVGSKAIIELCRELRDENKIVGYETDRISFSGVYASKPLKMLKMNSGIFVGVTCTPKYGSIYGRTLTAKGIVQAKEQGLPKLTAILSRAYCEINESCNMLTVTNSKWDGTQWNTQWINVFLNERPKRVIKKGDPVIVLGPEIKETVKGGKTFYTLNGREIGGLFI